MSGPIHDQLHAAPSLEGLPTIGEQIDLPCGSIVQTPHPDTLARLMTADPRVRYFPTDLEQAQVSAAGSVYKEAVTNPLGEHIAADFGGETVLARGTVASLTTGFPHWLGKSGRELQPMQSVLDILHTGSDSGQDSTRVSVLGADGELHYQTAHHFARHFETTDLELRRDPNREAVFPVLVVYRQDAFEQDGLGHGWNTLTGQPDERVAAIYIADRIVSTDRPDRSEGGLRERRLEAAARAIMDEEFDF